MAERPIGLGPMLEMYYATLEGNKSVEAYHDRHGTKSLGILTVTDDERGAALASYLAPRITGKVVVEIGAGIGLLALHLSEYARRVYAIEADPAWMSCFVVALYAKKPKHVSYLFGAADEFAGQIRGDVALFVTHSGRASMREAAALFAPEVIDVHGEILGDKAYPCDVVRGDVFKEKGPKRCSRPPRPCRSSRT